MHRTNELTPIQSLQALDLNLLKVLDALWKCRGITAAGRMIGLSQPAVSHALQRLRLAFADELFLRGPGALVPTPRAAELCRAAGAALAALEQAILPAAPFRPEVSERRFRIGMNDHVSATLLPRLLRRVGEAAPAVGLEVIHLPRGQNREGPVLPRLLDEAQLELALGQIDPLPPRCRVQPLRRDPHVCVLRDEGPAEGFDMAAFLARRHVRVSSFPDRLSWMDAALAAQGLRRRIAVTVPHFQAALHIVAATDLLTTLPRGAVAPFAGALRLRMLPSPLPERLHGLDMAWLKAMDGDAGLTWLRGMVREAVAAEGSLAEAGAA
ncbi:LysR family transcriptional regulator [Falsiroseomonas sp.]|uniref:LysR family transcriptional regulator n=1 Tax=Falsiroseomonas sp. TaxID=2870721 RepID=UPI003F6FBBB0